MGCPGRAAGIHRSDSAPGRPWQRPAPAGRKRAGISRAGRQGQNARADCMHPSGFWLHEEPMSGRQAPIPALARICPASPLRARMPPPGRRRRLPVGGAGGRRLRSGGKRPAGGREGRGTFKMRRGYAAGGAACPAPARAGMIGPSLPPPPSPSPSHDPRMQSVPTGRMGESRTLPGGAAFAPCALRALAATASECRAHATPIMYSPSTATIETTNCGGLEHCLPASLIEHLFGSTGACTMDAI